MHRSPQFCRDQLVSDLGRSGGDGLQTIIAHDITPHVTPAVEVRNRWRFCPAIVAPPNSGTLTAVNFSVARTSRRNRVSPVEGHERRPMSRTGTPAAQQSQAHARHEVLDCHACGRSVRRTDGSPAIARRDARHRSRSGAAETWSDRVRRKILAHHRLARGARADGAGGFTITPFARNLDSPRWLYVLPNGDVLVAEAHALPKSDQPGSIRQHIVASGSVGVSPNRIMLLRDADRDGVAEARSVFLDNLNQPFGTTLVGETLFVANTDGVMRFP